MHYIYASPFGWDFGESYYMTCWLASSNSLKRSSKSLGNVVTTVYEEISKIVCPIVSYVFPHRIWIPCTRSKVWQEGSTIAITPRDAVAVFGIMWLYEYGDCRNARHVSQHCQEWSEVGDHETFVRMSIVYTLDSQLMCVSLFVSRVHLNTG